MRRRGRATAGRPWPVAAFFGRSARPTTIAACFGVQSADRVQPTKARAGRGRDSTADPFFLSETSWIELLLEACSDYCICRGSIRQAIAEATDVAQFHGQVRFEDQPMEAKSTIADCRRLFLDLSQRFPENRGRRPGMGRLHVTPAVGSLPWANCSSASSSSSLDHLASFPSIPAREM